MTDDGPAINWSGKLTSSVMHRSPAGASPGTLIQDPNAPPPKVTAIAFDAHSLDETTYADTHEIARERFAGKTMWINVDGVANAASLQKLGKLFALHDLALEDVINVHQRPKADLYDGFLFVVTRMPANSLSDGTEQISIFIGDDFVITVQENEGDHFDPVRARLRKGGRIRSLGADYLAYALIDAIVDSFYPLLEAYGEAIEALEEEALANPTSSVLASIHQARRDLNSVRHVIWPQRELLNSLLRDDFPYIGDGTRLYLRDCYDHTIQLMDTLESYRDVVSSMTDLYLNSISMRMNEIMKVLTMIATVFIPLGFIAGVYGMNFDRSASPWNMPELGWAYGYPIALAVMTIVALAFLVFFFRKGWIATPKHFDWRSFLHLSRHRD